MRSAATRAAPLPYHPAGTSNPARRPSAIAASYVAIAFSYSRRTYAASARASRVLAREPSHRRSRTSPAPPSASTPPKIQNAPTADGPDREDTNGDIASVVRRSRPAVEVRDGPNERRSRQATTAKRARPAARTNASSPAEPTPPYPRTGAVTRRIRPAT